MAIPNYEAVAVCAILLCLKLVFRLDDVTEFALSHLVREINERNGVETSTKTFEFKEWLQLAGLHIQLKIGVCLRTSVLHFQNRLKHLIYLSLADALLKIKSRDFPSFKEVERNDGDGNGDMPRDVAYLAKHYAHNLVNKYVAVV